MLNICSIDFHFSKVQSFTSENFVIYFNLCDTLPPEYCGDKKQLCIKRKQDDVLFISGLELKTCKYINQIDILYFKEFQNFTVVYIELLFI